MSGTFKSNVTTSKERERLLAEWGRHTWHRFAVLDWDWAENLGIREECRGWSREQIEEWRKELHMATYTPEQDSEDLSDNDKLATEQMVTEIFAGVDEEMAKERQPIPLHFTEGAMAHLARYVEAIVGLPGDQPLWMHQNVKLEGNDNWYKVEVKIERLHKATPPPDDFCEEDYPEHIYPDWMVLPPPMAAVERKEKKPCKTCNAWSDDDELPDCERCMDLWHEDTAAVDGCQYWRERS